MKLILFCGSVEPSSDGLVDYSRRLFSQLIRLGHQAQIISLCDFHIFNYTTRSQGTNWTKVQVYKIPALVSNSQREKFSQDILIEFQPDWISLQFVPYSFNPKGLPFWLPSFLKKLKGDHQWHTMFHKLWLGIDFTASFRHKCIVKLKQLIIKQLINKIRPHIISTQNQLYQLILKSHNFSASILPIFSNIPYTAVKKEINKFNQFVVFGTIYPGAPFKDFAFDLISSSKSFEKPINFVFIGNNRSELNISAAILENYNICYEVIGYQCEKEISQVLIDSDYGISTTPYFQTEKSGVYAAYREHQINTICVSRKWTPTKGQYNIPQIIKYEKNNLNLIPMDVDAFNLNSLANKFLNSISKI